MPRLSQRQKFIQQTRRRIEQLETMAEWDDAMRLEVGQDIALMLNVMREHLRQVENQRYLTEREHLPSLNHWIGHLNDVERFNEAFFLRHYRMDRQAFWELRDMLAPLDVFWSDPDREPQAPAELQILTMLKYLGTDGTDGSYAKIADHLGCSVGAVNKFVNRTTQAFMEIRESVVYWPDKDKREDISNQMLNTYGFHGCVGMVDGTLLPLEFKPTTNGEDYFTRKSNYAVNALVFCDMTARIRYIEVGWPGSVHDNRVWRNTPQVLMPEKYFSTDEYVLGDSAFTPGPNMVPAFKKPPKAPLGDQEVFFNTKLAKARIKTEHCIGLLKGRFPRLKSFRVKIHSKKNMGKIVKHTYCAAILHNLLISEELPENAIIDQHDDDDTVDMDESVSGDRTTTNTDDNDKKRDEVFESVLNYFGQ